ncbi:MAG TPA: SRPBCC family protein [Thermoanaerobaculia bacterium]|nr:SRPBCC family protein [Thermoanaerobaculia bacterium]
MRTSEFVYVTYIKTTPEKVWNAMTDPEMTKQYRFGTHAESDWKAGSPWRMIGGDGQTLDSGEIVESHPPHRLVIKWRNEWRPEFRAEGYSRCTFEIEPEGNATKLTVRHVMDKTPSPFIEAVADGWSRTLSNLKSLLETGTVVLEGTR